MTSGGLGGIGDSVGSKASLALLYLQSMSPRYPTFLLALRYRHQAANHPLRGQVLFSTTSRYFSRKRLRAFMGLELEDVTIDIRFPRIGI